MLQRKPAPLALDLTGLAPLHHLGALRPGGGHVGGVHVREVRVLHLASESRRNSADIESVRPRPGVFAGDLSQLIVII